MDDGLPSQRADATSVYDEMTTFDFVFILHLMKEIMEIIDILCQALQSKSQDIINAMELVLSTKNLLQQMRDNKWNDLLAKVKSFCELRNIDIPDFNAPYINRRGRARARQDNFTIEHHYQVDLFYASIDSQLQEINGRFNDDAMELLILSNALNPKNAVESFRIEDICKLVEKFYVQDFTSDEKEQLEIQLKHYEYNVVKGPDYKNLSTIPELCQWLVKTNKSVTYNLVFRVIILVLTLPVSTATTERSFFAMNIVKTRLRSKMEDAFLSDTLKVIIDGGGGKCLSLIRGPRQITNSTELIGANLLEICSKLISAIKIISRVDGFNNLIIQLMVIIGGGGGGAFIGGGAPRGTVAGSGGGGGAAALEAPPAEEKNA
ncbi:uncharacterized protein LOC141821690 [Curcuma longa]|uniref:uncharacterized protein LOC141821690 n=1 Tax=Curcuma longa TaxID=136217 RepID=UPI003D9E8CFF